MKDNQVFVAEWTEKRKAGKWKYVMINLILTVTTATIFAIIGRLIDIFSDSVAISSRNGIFFIVLTGLYCVFFSLYKWKQNEDKYLELKHFF